MIAEKDEAADGCSAQFALHASRSVERCIRHRMVGRGNRQARFKDGDAANAP